MPVRAAELRRLFHLYVDADDPAESKVIYRLMGCALADTDRPDQVPLEVWEQLDAAVAAIRADIDGGQPWEEQIDGMIRDVRRERAAALSPTAERNAQIFDRHRAGETLRSIAAAYGLSQARVQYIVIREGGRRRLQP